MNAATLRLPFRRNPTLMERVRDSQPVRISLLVGAGAACATAVRVLDRRRRHMLRDRTRPRPDAAARGRSGAPTTPAAS